MLTASTRLRLLRIALRIGGVLLVTAFVAVFLPTGWMAASHRWLGLGEFPDVPLVQYLARSIAALYGFHGVLLFIVARDPVRYRPIISFIACMNLLFGLMMLAIDLHAGMPLYWTLGEGPPIMMTGLVIWWLQAPLHEPVRQGQIA